MRTARPARIVRYLSDRRVMAAQVEHVAIPIDGRTATRPDEQPREAALSRSLNRLLASQLELFVRNVGRRLAQIESQSLGAHGDNASSSLGTRGTRRLSCVRFGTYIPRRPWVKAGAARDSPDSRYLGPRRRRSKCEDCLWRRVGSGTSASCGMTPAAAVSTS